ncbi:hypothetical protein [Ferriphaselus sp. R-1]|uniref:hypothetical protein n=1 Tax=Ferriphaselus sp. R-1 TaxID=1485544 RepID=UPI0005563537|nr:hypothetical protein [Ferriphaselus sp. R-1]
MNTKHTTLALALSAALASGQALACGAGFCLADTGWDAQGSNVREGFTFGLRYEYIKSDQLRSGTGKLPNFTVATAAAGDEITTTNQNFVANLGYTFSPQWQAEIEAPMLKRYHQHGSATPGAPDTWDFTTLGDVKLLASYRLGGESPNGFTVRVGVKLPTGKTNQMAVDGLTAAERMFQPGTGTTDGILGLSYNSSPPDGGLRWFASATAQQALNTAGDNGTATGSYKPGYSVALATGLAYPLTHEVALTAQANLHISGSEGGQAGVPANTGGQTLALSPGISIAAAPDTRIYALLQVPVYQNVTGTQLTSNLGATLGITQRF